MKFLQHGFGLAVVIFTTVSANSQITVCPANPHYFYYNGKPVVLITSDHHYGAVIDKDFDFVKYLDYLADNGLNLTRIYPDWMFEPPDKYIHGNPLGPAPEDNCFPG